MNMLDKMTASPHREDAEDLLERAVEIQSHAVPTDELAQAQSLHNEEGPDSPNVGFATTGLARTLRQANRSDEAETPFRTGIRLMEAGWGPDDPDVRQARSDLDELLADS